MSRLLLGALLLAGCQTETDLVGVWVSHDRVSTVGKDAAEPVICEDGTDTLDLREDGSFTWTVEVSTPADPECAGEREWSQVETGRWALLEGLTGDGMLILAIHREHRVVDDSLAGEEEVDPSVVQWTETVMVGDPVDERRWVGIGNLGLYWEK